DSDGKNTDSDDATIYVGRHESLTKKSVDYKPGEQSVQWEVNVNFNEKKMEIGQKIEDTFTFSTKDGDFTDVFEIKEDSIEIIEVQEFNEDGTIKESKVLENNGELFTVEITEGSITYTLEKESNKAYIFRYHTKVKEDAYITEGGKITNTVRFDGKTKISEQGIIQQVGKKSHGLINYENKTIDWTIIINADKQDLRNFKLTDDFSGSGQKLVAGSVKISPTKGDVSSVPAADNEGFEINFENITDSYTINYQTEFAYYFGNTNPKPEFNNHLHLKYDTKYEEDKKLTIKDTVKPNAE